MRKYKTILTPNLFVDGVFRLLKFLTAVGRYS